MTELRFFKCNVLGGFRLSDLAKQVRQDEYFYVESRIVETSRAIIAAIREKWVVEVSEKEASKHISIPYIKKAVQETHLEPRSGAVNRSQGLATPDVRQVNRNLESRQAESNKIASDKPAIPDFKKVEASTKERQSDSINKTGASTDQELLKGDKSIEQVAGPDFSKAGKSEQAEKKPEVKKEPKPEVKKEPKPEVKVQEDVTVKALSDDSVFDNSQLSTPNFDERNIKQQVQEQVEEKVAQKRRIKRKTSEEAKQ